MGSLIVKSGAASALLICALPAQAAVYFSEYVEGSSNNKAVEIVNSGASAVDLTGYSLQLFFNGSATAGSTINLSGSIAPGDVYVVANSSASFAASADLSTSSLSFNGDDAVTLRDASATVLDVIGQIGVDPGSEWGTGTTSTADNTLRRLDTVSGGDPIGSDAFDPSLEWLGFATDTFDGLGCAGEAACAGGDPEPVTITRIFEIQGAAHVSPLAGQTVTTRGVVTALRNSSGRGFYLQDPDGDANPDTSDGLFVYTNSAPTVSVGQEVQVTGTVSEFRPGGSGGTNNLSGTQLGGTLTIVAPADVFFINTSVSATVLGAAGRTPPVTVVDDDTSGSVEVTAETTYDPASDGIDFYESLEGMLLRVDNAQVVGPRSQYGEVWVVADLGANATGINARGGITLLDLGGGAVDYQPERIQFDDLLFGSMPGANVGDTVASATGVLSYDFGNFELLLTAAPSFTNKALAPEVAEVAGGADRLRIANYNVENLDPNDFDDNPNASGCPDADVAEGKFARIAEQIAASLGAPDIVALQEVQDETGCVDDGVVSSALTLATLIDAIVDAGGPAYSAFDIPPVNNADGGLPGGNIRVAYLYDASRVTLVGGTVGAGDSTTATSPALDAEGKLALTLSPGRVDPTSTAWDATRKPLAAVWQFNDERVVTVNNHWSSKGGGTPIYGRYQPFVNGSEAERVAQAEVVNAFVDSVLAVDAGAKVVVLGDLNEFSFIEPLAVLRGDADPAGPVLTDLVDAQLIDQERYTYNFEGNSQALDHLLVSDGLLAADPQADVVHVNSEFASQVSDHDPVVASFNLPQAPCDTDVVSFATRRFLADEGQVTVAITLERGATACGAIAVDLATTDRTASAGADYHALSTTVTWAQDDAAPKTVFLSLIDDTLREGTETLALTLSNPSRATIADGNALLVIRDNERR